MAYNLNTNPWAGFLEDNPDVLYGGYLSGLKNPSNSFLDYWTKNYGNVYNKYLGALGGQALSGNAPSMNFSDYLNSFNFNKQYNLLSPQSKGFYQPSGYSWNLGNR